MRHSEKAHCAGKGTASGKETSGTLSERVPPEGGGATEELREHCGALARTGRASTASVQVARSTDPIEPREESPPQNPRESTLRKEVHQLKRLLADKTLEVDFFRGALQKVEARRQRKGSSGEKASTTK